MKKKQLLFAALLISLTCLFAIAANADTVVTIAEQYAVILPDGFSQSASNTYRNNQTQMSFHYFEGKAYSTRDQLQALKEMDNAGAGTKSINGIIAVIGAKINPSTNFCSCDCSFTASRTIGVHMSVYFYFSDEQFNTATNIIDSLHVHFGENCAYCKNHLSAQTIAPDGFVQEGDNLVYYVNGEKYKGWYLEDDNWYYFDEDGILAYGWKQIDGNWYFFDPSMLASYAYVLDDVCYCFNDDGTLFDSGWYKSAKGNWFYCEDGKAANGWKNINGSWYYFQTGDLSGVMTTGWCQLGDAWYYFNSSGSMETGWQNIAGTWYFFDTSGAMVAGWKQIAGSWYYFSDSGEMATGWLKDKDENWYWFNSDGVMATGWQEINGTWQMFDKSGVWLYTWDGD